MIKTTVKIDGMQCNMCETHVKDLIRKKFDVKKIKASHVNGECVIVSPERFLEKSLLMSLDRWGIRLLKWNQSHMLRKGYLDFSSLGDWALGSLCLC